ncbi:hypothetical protein Dalk_4775 [Desulfatibacillum aliphaticivorans]|uniref:Peptidase n=1 Tax=Desulfatibacillum aliphaticivorans TaxID=218208 RepID=B8FD22_DESAL|nr:hypothetical protein [Desulfatibacillum aliphaticivorans]ACL06453.1 hypothetical protein Dalk_4775 [Desulfatibacillum aliphaticivorans]
MWVEVFKTGTHTASNGTTVSVSENDLDEIASRYDASEHEAPVVIGHPKENAPAYGWVQALKRNGSTLLAKLNLVPEFVEMVKKGLYKKRSISLYADKTLRHVGFLGAMPPAVKGLADIKFQEEGKMAINFSTDFNSGKSAGEQLEEKVQEILAGKMCMNFSTGKMERVLTYQEALSAACKEFPELAEAYLAEL